MSKAADSSTTKKERDRATLARKQFIVALFDLTWRMAIALLAPTFLGIWADGKFEMGGVAIIGGFVLGIVLSLVIIVINARNLTEGLK
jgi:hypothetical protein